MKIFDNRLSSFVRVVFRYGIRCFLLLVLGFPTLGYSEYSDSSQNQAVNLLQESEIVLKPFVWLNTEFDNTEAGFQKQLDYGDPNRVTMLLFQDWLARHDPVSTSLRIDQVIAKWSLLEPNGHLNYTFAYGRLPAGWRSGMDSWSFPMLLIGLWQETGQERYKQLADKLILYTSRDVLDGGTVWRSGEGCWFSEYAWTGMRKADEFYVLNGHLLALQAIKMIANATGDASMARLYRCGVRATKARSSQFLVGDKWALYMLEPKTINQTHYVIFETMQFDALAALDRDPFFREQAALRRQLLKQHFPVYARRVAAKSYLTLSAVGAPHPYSIDTYPLYLACTDGSRSANYALPHPTQTSTPVAEAAMLNAITDLAVSTTICRVDAAYAGKRFMLYEGPVKVLKGISPQGVSIEYVPEATLDAYSKRSKIVVDPGRRTSPLGSPDSYLDTQGRLILYPKASIDWKADQLLGFEFDADGELSLGVNILSDGREFFRYYPKTRAGNRTLVLLSPIGFDNF